MAAVAAICAVTPTRCSSPDTSGRIVARDSAGVSIVETPASVRAEAERWSLSPAPTLSIGRTEGPPEYQLFRVVAALRLDDGRVVVGDNGSASIRWYDADGVHLRSVGRDGEGPGEYRNLRVLGRYGADSLVAWDGILRRLTVLDIDGMPGRAVTVPESGEDVYFHTPVGDGSLLGNVDQGVQPGQLTAGIHENTTTYLRLMPNGRLDTIGRFFGNEFLITRDHSLTGPPFARSGVSTAAPGGFWHGANDSHEIREYSLSGRLERILRVAGAERPLSRAEIDAYIEADLARPRDADALRRRTEFFDSAPFPEALPAFAGLAVDRAGNLWAAEYRLDDDQATEWSVFGPDGGLVARLTTPARLRVTDIGADYIMGVERDELDVEHVVVYGIIGR